MVIDKEYSGAKELILPVSSLWVSCVGTAAAAAAAHSFNLSTVSADDSTISFTHLREKTPCLLFRINRVVIIQRICLIVYVNSGRVKCHDAFHLDNKNPVSVIGFFRGWLCTLLQVRWVQTYLFLMQTLQR